MVGRYAVLAFGLLAMICGSTVARAQSQDAGIVPVKKAALMRADTLVYDPENDTVIATGHVEVDYEDEYLRADRLTYDQRNDKITADGDVTLIDKSQNALFAQHVELTDSLRDGVVQRIGMLLSDNSRIAANSAIRLRDNTTVLNKVVFSPCDLCETDKDRAPLWQLRAKRAIHDKERQSITYHDATLDVLGVPVAYFPYFEHPDPSVKRKSGFLMPVVGSATELGAFATVPYYIVLSESHDLTLTPTVMSHEGLLMRGETRQRFRKGGYIVDTSIIRADERNEYNNETGGKDWRGHFFANGQYDLTPVWRAGADLQLVTDDTYMRRYKLGTDDRLENHLYLQGIKGRSFIDASGYTFRDLRASDIPGQTPVVAPLINMAFVTDTPVIGGRTALKGNFLSLTRAAGTDVRRFSGTLDWERTVIAPLGQVVRGFAKVRTDFYITNDANPTGIIGGPDNSTTSSRVLPDIGVDWRWPFARAAGRFTQLIEPIVQFIYAPKGGNELNIPNEDSQAFEFDEGNLFTDERYPGYDRWEDGSRFNYGARIAQYWPEGGYIEFYGGQSYRLLDNSPFAAGTGLDKKASDIVGAVTISPNEHLSLSQRFRLDNDDFSLERSETSADFDYWRLSGRVSYTLVSSADAAATTTALEGLRARAAFKLTENWSLLGATQEDFSNHRSVYREVGVGYINSCLDLGIIYRRDYTRDRDIEPSDSIVVRLRLTNLGS